MHISKILRPLLFATLIVGMPWAAMAQTNANAPLIPELGNLLPESSGGQEVTISGSYKLTADGRYGELSVTADLKDGWHIYSVTQKSGGPHKTQIVVESKQVELLGPFVPDQKPKVKKLEYFKVPAEEHYGKVTWTAPFEVVGQSSTDLVIRGDVKGQVCDEVGSCIPLVTSDTTFAAKQNGALAKPPAISSDAPRRTPPVESTATVDTSLSLANFKVPAGKGYRDDSSHASIRGTVPGSANPGDTIQLVLTVEPEPGWHVYGYASKVEPTSISKPTIIGMVSPSSWSFGEPKVDGNLIVKETGLSMEPIQSYYEQTATWTISVTIPADAKPGETVLRGMMGYQTCTDARCDRPTAADFAVKINVGGNDTATIPVMFASAKYSAVAKFIDTGETPDAVVVSPQTLGDAATTSFDLSRIQVADDLESSFGYILLLAFVGGFILNFMPCVLPVIGLKVMAFVQQAGENRGRILMLNIWYALGMISIFWLLATLASAASLGLSSRGLGWGEQFNYDGFTIPLLSVVFMMGLSFLGVWEIPIPGFAGGNTANELAAKEGASGAFFKGVITTVLATPCSGPGLATALTWSATKPPLLVYLVFTAMGLGMAFPYLLIGAFPQLVRFIPKPGAWMDTFKQLMGFVLLGTVVYMFTLISPGYVVPTIALIFALWAACWWIGRVPAGSDFVAQGKAWIAGGIFAAIIGWFAFGYEANNEHELPWQPYSLATLDENIRANRTVMIDFTADW